MEIGRVEPTAVLNGNIIAICPMQATLWLVLKQGQGLQWQALNPQTGDLLHQRPLPLNGRAIFLPLPKIGICLLAVTEPNFPNHAVISAWDAQFNEVWRLEGERFSAVTANEAQTELFLTDGNGFLLGLTAVSGKIAHRIPLETTPTAAAPLFYQQQLYIPCRQQLLAYSSDGTLRWRYSWPTAAQQGWFSTTPCYANGTLIASSNHGFVLGLDPATGQEKWQTAVGPAGKSLTQPVSNGRTLFVGARDGLYALDTTSGHIIWSCPMPRGVILPPVIRGDTVTAVGRDRSVRLLQAATGDPLARYDMAQRTELPPIWLADDTLLLADESGVLNRWLLQTAVLPFAADDEAAYIAFAEQCESEQRLLQAAQLWRHIGRDKRAANLFDDYAESLVGHVSDDDCAKAWQQAAAAYLAVDQPDDHARCLRRVAFHRRLPIIILDVTYTTLLHGRASDLILKAENKGFGIASQLAVKAESDNGLFAGEILYTQKIVRMTPGDSRELPLTVRPLQHGPNVPLQLTLSYLDEQGHYHAETQLISVSVVHSAENANQTQQLTNILGHQAENGPSGLPQITNYRLFQACREFLELADLHEICLLMELDRDDFAQEKKGFLLDFIPFLEKRGRIDEFRQCCQRINPNPKAGW